MAPMVSGGAPLKPRLMSSCRVKPVTFTPMVVTARAWDAAARRRAETSRGEAFWRGERAMCDPQKEKDVGHRSPEAREGAGVRPALSTSVFARLPMFDRGVADAIDSGRWVALWPLIPPLSPCPFYQVGFLQM